MANTTKVDNTEALLSRKLPEINKENVLNPERDNTTAPTVKAQDESDESIKLTTKDNKEATLTASQLEQWFANIEARNLQYDKKDKHIPHPHDPEVHPSYLATIYLGRYGLKSAKDVITFLKSPAGHDVLTMIGEQLAAIASIKEAIHQQQLDSETRRHRALAALLLGLAYEKEAKAKEKYAEIQKDIDKKLHKPAETAATTTATSNAEAAAQYAAYTESINALQNTLEEKLKKSEALEEELEQELQEIEQQDHVIEERYENLGHNVDTLDHFEMLMKAFTMSPEERVQALSGLEEKIAQLKDQASVAENENLAQKLYEQVSNLLTISSFLQRKTESPESTSEFIEVRMKGLKKTLKAQAAEIGRKIETNDDEGAMRLLHEHNGLHVQFEGLKDMVAVLKGEKNLWRLDGQPSGSFGEPGFILPKGKSVVFDKVTNKHYLLQSHQDPEKFHLMSIEDKAVAEKDFERARPGITNIKTLVHQNKTTETGIQSQKRQAISERSEAMQQEILLITNQLTKLQAARANVELIMNQMNKDELGTGPNAKPSMPISTPKPSLSKGGHTVSTPNVVAQSYRHILLLMKANPTPQSISNLQSIFRRPDGSIDPSMQSILKNIKSGQPIPQQTMTSLLQNIERLGVSANKPNVTTIRSPLAKVHEEPSTAPTPFSTKLTPKPYS